MKFVDDDDDYDDDDDDGAFRILHSPFTDIGVAKRISTHPTHLCIQQRCRPITVLSGT